QYFLSLLVYHQNFYTFWVAKFLHLSGSFFIWYCIACFVIPYSSASCLIVLSIFLPFRLASDLLDCLPFTPYLSLLFLIIHFHIRTKFISLFPHPLSSSISRR